MNKFILYVLLIAGLQFATGCNPDETSVIETVSSEEGDSVSAEVKKLRSELRQKDSAINQSIRMFNEIEENLSAIANKQGVINLNAKDPELAEGERSKIIEEITSINTLLQENKEKVNILRSKLQKADVKIGELEKMLERMIKDVAEKENTIAELREELAKYDIAMDELTAVLNEKDEVIAEKDDELNTAFYVIGTSKELKEQGIITKSGGFIGIGKLSKLKEDFNKDYFTKIDIQKVKEITLGNKKVDLLTTHAKTAYKFKGEKIIEKLEISNPKEFWSVSKYLVMVVE
jgi:DNA-binding protein H-NS